jgi:hypothetical protein
MSQMWVLQGWIQKINFTTIFMRVYSEITLNMTICIAAIGQHQGEEVIVFSTDHMVTIGELGQFEHSILKWREISPKTIAMLAGNPIFFDDLTKLTTDSLSFSEIADEVHKNFKEKRRNIINSEIYDIYGIDNEFVKGALAAAIPNQHIAKILDQISQYNLQTQILLIGFESELAQISVVDESNIANFRVINFNAIGSGMIQAVNTLMFQKHGKDDDVLRTLYDVYKAKRNAEVAQGVGKETELLTLSQKTGCARINEAQFNLLSEIYDEELKMGRTHPDLEKLTDHGQVMLECS